MIAEPFPFAYSPNSHQHTLEPSRCATTVAKTADVEYNGYRADQPVALLQRQVASIIVSGEMARPT